MKMKVIMGNAWIIARKGQRKFGGKVSEYFAEALKISWALYKKEKARKGGDIVMIAPWFLEKKFGHKSMIQQINGDSILKIKKETEKAYLIEAVAYYEGGKVEIKNEFWAPKSVCA